MSVTTTSLAPRSGNLGIQLAGHLLRRTSFRLTKPRVNQLAAMTANAAVDDLFNNASPTPYIPRPLDYEISGGEWIDDDSAPDGNETLRRYWVCVWWFRNALYDPSATHKLAFFIHTLFPVSHNGTSGSGVSFNQLSRFFFDHLALLNYAADNNMDLKTLAKKITLDNFMLCYLNNRLNKYPNNDSDQENYAREFLEIFTIGRGEQESEGVYTNYTEADIKKVARLLTGFTTKSTRNGSDIDSDTGIFAGYAIAANHDPEDKTFSNKLGNTTITGRSTITGMYQELEDLTNMVFGQLETARNYARKMYRFYVNTTITQNIENTVITALANDLLANGYNFVTTLKLLLKSEHFYSMCTAVNGGGNIIKSSVELLAEAMSFFNMDLPTLSGAPTATEIEQHFHRFGSSFLFNSFGQNGGLLLFAPIAVAGYPAYHQEPLRDKNWYNSTTIPTRYNIGKLFLSQYHIENILYTGIDSVAFANYLADTLGVDVGDADTMVDAIVDYLLPQTLTTDRRDIIKNLFLNNLSPVNWQCEWGLYHGDGCNVAPGVPPDGDKERVRPHLDALIVAVLSTQEFQLK